MGKWRLPSLAAIVLSIITGVAQPVSADSLFMISIDTRPLAGVNAQLAVDFIDGDGASNTVTLSGFSTDGTLGPATTIGDVSGSLPGTVTFTDASFFNELLQDILLGDSIAFILTLTQNFTGPTPDALSLFLFDPTTGLPLFTTTDPTGANALFAVDIDGTGFGNPQTFASTGQPDATLTATVPAPTTLVLLGTGLAVLGIRRRLNWKL